ncbi:MAG: hypothetical protein HY900_15580 [Deltaproteobacteria bacterium]|nr:hypothetical protein [Deltaproteobacteria bacterium]
MGSSYQEVLETGGKRIIEMALELARGERLPVRRIFWGDGKIEPNYVSQVLTIETGEERIKGVFHEAWISGDGKLERDRAEKVLKEMIERVGRA